MLYLEDKIRTMREKVNLIAIRLVMSNRSSHPNLILSQARRRHWCASHKCKQSPYVEKHMLSMGAEGHRCKSLRNNNRTMIKPWCVRVCSLSRVQLFATPWTGAHQASLSIKFSRQEYWSGSPFPPPGDLPHLSDAGQST